MAIDSTQDESLSLVEQIEDLGVADLRFGEDPTDTVRALSSAIDTATSLFSDIGERAAEGKDTSLSEVSTGDPLPGDIEEGKRETAEGVEALITEVFSDSEASDTDEAEDFVTVVATYIVSQRRVADSQLDEVKGVDVSLTPGDEVDEDELITSTVRRIAPQFLRMLGQHTTEDGREIQRLKPNAVDRETDSATKEVLTEDEAWDKYLTEANKILNRPNNRGPLTRIAKTLVDKEIWREVVKVQAETGVRIIASDS